MQYARLTLIIALLLSLSGCLTGRNQISTGLRNGGATDAQVTDAVRGDITSFANPDYLSGISTECLERAGIAPRIKPVSRPEPRDKPQDAYNKCLNWAKVAKRKVPRANRLVIQYEGLGGYSKKLANSLYQYQDNLLAGRSAPMPKTRPVFSAAQNTMRLNMRDNYRGVEYLVLPHDTKKGVSEKCVEAFHRVFGRDLKLKVVGHSFGGNAARKLVQRLQKSRPDIRDIRMLTLDSRAPVTGYSTGFWTPVNVSRNDVFFQKSPLLPGYKYKSRGGVTVNHNRITGPEVSRIRVPCKGSNRHMKMACTDRVQDAYRRLLQD
jgi:hypothetical protein